MLLLDPLVPPKTLEPDGLAFTPPNTELELSLLYGLKDLEEIPELNGLFGLPPKPVLCPKTLVLDTVWPKLVLEVTWPESMVNDVVCRAGTVGG